MLFMPESKDTSLTAGDEDAADEEHVETTVPEQGPVTA